MNRAEDREGETTMVLAVRDPRNYDRVHAMSGDSQTILCVPVPGDDMRSLVLGLTRTRLPNYGTSTSHLEWRNTPNGSECGEQVHDRVE